MVEEVDYLLHQQFQQCTEGYTLIKVSLRAVRSRVAQGEMGRTVTTWSSLQTGLLKHSLSVL